MVPYQAIIWNYMCVLKTDKKGLLNSDFSFILIPAVNIVYLNGSLSLCSPDCDWTLMCYLLHIDSGSPFHLTAGTASLAYLHSSSSLQLSALLSYQYRRSLHSFLKATAVSNLCLFCKPYMHKYMHAYLCAMWYKLILVI